MSIPRYPPDPARLLRARDVGRMLGLHEQTVWKMTAAGRLPKPIRLGHATRWRHRDIEAFVDERQAEQETEITVLEKQK